MAAYRQALEQAGQKLAWDPERDRANRTAEIVQAANVHVRSSSPRM